MQPETNEIIERTPGMNNEEMWKQCELLKSVVFQTIQVKSGRGKGVRITEEFKHDTPSEIRNRIANSCEYYKKLYEEDMKTDKVQIDAVIDILNADPIGSIEFRDYQLDIIKLGAKTIEDFGFVYLAMEVRTGKTLTSLGIAELICSSNVLFLTKKKAISSIQRDYEMLNPPYHLTVTNYENLHKIDTTDWDLIVLDEAHSCFLENTLIDGVKIKDIELGSLQKSFNFAKGIYEYRKVLNVFKNPLTENLIKIKCNGKEIVCTENHKIFTKRGWVKAGELLPTDELQVL